MFWQRRYILYQKRCLKSQFHNKKINAEHNNYNRKSFAWTIWKLTNQSLDASYISSLPNSASALPTTFEIGSHKIKSEHQSQTNLKFNSIKRKQINANDQKFNQKHKHNYTSATHWKWDKEFVRSLKPIPSAWSMDVVVHIPETLKLKEIKQKY